MADAVCAKAQSGLKKNRVKISCFMAMVSVRLGNEPTVFGREWTSVEAVISLVTIARAMLCSSARFTSKPVPTKAICLKAD